MVLTEGNWVVLHRGNPVVLNGGNRAVLKREIFHHTPFPIHGAATLEADGVYVNGRIPLGAVGFLLAWISGWTTGRVMAGSQVPIGAFGMVALGWLLAGAMIIFSLLVERPRFERALEALVRDISCNPA